MNIQVGGKMLVIVDSYQPQTTCNSKKTYSTKERATDVLHTLKIRKATGTIQDMCWAKRAYYCEEHRGWHLTKTDLRRGRIGSDVLPGDY